LGAAGSAVLFDDIEGVLIMKHFRLLGVAVIAMFALGGSLAASEAFALPEILPVTGNQHFTGSNDGTAKLVLESKAGTEIGCTAATSTGFQETGSLGTFHIAFTGCNTAILGKCNTVGEAAETILSFGSFHYVLDTLGGATEEQVALLLLLTPITFECTSFAKNEVKGTLVCLILKPLVASKNSLFHCNKGKSKGEQEDKGYYNDAGTLVASKLESALNGAAFEESNELALAAVLFKEAVSFMTD
jgi:hypothetical protein